MTSRPEVVQGIEVGRSSVFGPEPVEGKPLYDLDSIADPATKSAMGRFVYRGYNDCWAAVLFLLTLAITLVLGIVNMSATQAAIEQSATHAPRKHPASGSGSPAPQAPTTVSTILVATGLLLFIASISSFVVLSALHKAPRKAIIACNSVVAGLYAVSAITAFGNGVFFMGVIFLFFAGLQILWLYFVRDRIPFAALILEISTHICMRYKASIASGFLGVVAFYVYIIFYVSMQFPVSRRLLEQQQQDGQVQGGDAALWTLYLLFFFWTSQVILNVCHVTVSGLVATWYFCGDHNMPKNPTLSSLKRALTTSFGSICFGSLLVAIIKTLHYLAEQNRRRDNDFIRCVTACILSCLEGIMEYFNTYAFVHIAIYGCGYVEASRRTWALAKDHFWRGAFNDCLIGPTISWTSIGAGLFAGLIAGIAVGPAFGVLTFIVTVAVVLMVLRCLESAVPTLFVCYCECPDALLNSSAELYAMLTATDRGVHQS
jgi:hypothetical protein